MATAPDNGAPDPIAHATPDVDLADAQLAVGRPEPMAEADPVLDAELEAQADAEAGAPLLTDGAADEGAPADVGSELAVEVRGRGTAGTAVAEPRVALGARLIAFLQGSWRELQRVQWPDRRQVVQATGVVLGFVIIAGLYLGLADTVASKLMDLILK